MDRRVFLVSSATALAAAALTGCGRAIGLLAPEPRRPTYERMGPVPDGFAIGADGDYDYAVLRFDNSLGQRVGFFTPWWPTTTILTMTNYVRQQFHGWPFGYWTFGDNQYLYYTLYRMAQRDGEEGWRYAIYQGTAILPQAEWEALVGNFGQAVEDTLVPRHGVVDFRWGPPL